MRKFANDFNKIVKLSVKCCGLFMPAMILPVMAVSCSSIQPGKSSGDSKNIRDIAEVLPWNGKKAAVSLTFDDGGPSHLSIAIPELDKRGFKGTFYLISDDVASSKTAGAWKAAGENGHELGNHTKSHQNMSYLSETEAKFEIDSAETAISNFSGIRPLSFAYPYCAFNTGDYLAAKYPAARGIVISNLTVSASNEPYWPYIPSGCTGTAVDPVLYGTWIDEAESKGEWLVFQIHGVTTNFDTGEFNPVPRENLQAVLDRLKTDEAAVWVERFGYVASYLRASFLFMEAVVSVGPNSALIKWQVPSWCPAGLILKVRLKKELEYGAIRQGSSILIQNPDSSFPLDFSYGEAVIY